MTTSTRSARFVTRSSPIRATSSSTSALPMTLMCLKERPNYKSTVLNAIVRDFLIGTFVITKDVAIANLSAVLLREM